MFLQPTDLPHFHVQLHLSTTNQMSCSHQDQQQLASNFGQKQHKTRQLLKKMQILLNAAATETRKLSYCKDNHVMRPT